MIQLLGEDVARLIGAGRSSGYLHCCTFDDGLEVASVGKYQHTVKNRLGYDSKHLLIESRAQSRGLLDRDLIAIS